MLVHQAKRLNSPCLMVANHDASVFPMLYYHDVSVHALWCLGRYGLATSVFCREVVFVGRFVLPLSSQTRNGQWAYSETSFYKDHSKRKGLLLTPWAPDTSLLILCPQHPSITSYAPGTILGPQHPSITSYSPGTSLLHLIPLVPLYYIFFPRHLSITSYSPGTSLLHLMSQAPLLFPRHLSITSYSPGTSLLHLMPQAPLYDILFPRHLSITSYSPGTSLLHLIPQAPLYYILCPKHPSITSYAPGTSL